ncbi:hypothetical protein BJV77DRAFT_498700 [Russula vinacea]|nr:hypothetical protein BJV77DRAFT_498700 [Russula vinacea]
MAPRRKCNVCGSQHWHKEPATGLVVCSEGHVLQNYLTETFETYEHGTHQGRKRALKSTREKRGRPSKANSELYYGARAEYLHFQCLQLLLRKQVAVLIQLWKLPNEFERLMGAALELVTLPPPPEPLLHQQATRGHNDDHDSEEKEVDEQVEKASPELSGVNPPEDDDSKDDSEIDELLRALSESSSSEDSRNDDKGQPRPKPEGSGRKSKMFGRSGPASNIALLMVACWTLRLPIMYLDLIRLIESYNLPYLEPLHHLPATMVRHLTKHNKQALSPAHAPTTLGLHSLTARLAKRLLAYKVHTPELNAAPMLWRVVRALGGGPVLYNLGKTVAHVLSLPLALHHTLAPRLKDDDPESRKYDNVPPELALFVAVVIVLKMVYGLDGQTRVPKNGTDPACALPRLKDYLTNLKGVKEEYMRSKQVAFSASSNISVLELDESALDEYLELCQRGLLGPETLRSDQRTLQDFFPLKSGRVGASRGKTAIERLEEDQRVPRAGVPMEGGTEQREPGEAYAVYSSRDVLGVLPEDMALVISYGASWIGVDDETILKVSEGYERRLSTWLGRQKRGEGIEGRRWSS